MHDRGVINVCKLDAATVHVTRIVRGLKGIKTDIYTHRTRVALLNELALKICSVEIQSRRVYAEAAA